MCSHVLIKPPNDRCVGVGNWCCQLSAHHNSLESSVRRWQATSYQPQHPLFPSGLNVPIPLSLEIHFQCPLSPSILTPTPAPLTRVTLERLSAVVSIRPLIKWKKGAVLTFCLQLDKVSQGERHGLGVYCVQDLGRWRASQRNAVVLNVIGHLHWIPRPRHPADAHHLIKRREEQWGK